MIDLIYLTFNRLEFTRESMKAMFANTEWEQVRKLVLYDDGSTDGTREYLKAVKYPVKTEFIFSKLGGPVAIMNHYLRSKPTEIFAKIDNDTMLPPYWLSECLKVMDAHKKLDLLGIESFYPIVEGRTVRSYVLAKHIGGIGVMRSRCFMSLPQANGRFGFTEWQHSNDRVRRGWINPSLPVFLLDRLHFEPWSKLSLEYVTKRWQRKWTPYDDTRSVLWGWWKRG